MVRSKVEKKNVKVLICRDLFQDLVQEFKTFSEYYGNIVLCETSMDEMRKMSIEKLIAVSIIFLTPESEDTVSFAKWINKVNSVCQLIFVGHDYSMLSRIYETKHAFFMLRDNIHTEMNQAMKCALHKLDVESNGTQISLYCGGIRHFILLNDIIFAEVMGRTLFIHTRQGTVYKTNCSLKKFSQNLPDWFIRTHNSYIVNRKQVLALEYPECILRNGEKIPISRHYRQEICARMDRQNESYDSEMTSYDKDIQIKVKK